MGNRCMNTHLPNLFKTGAMGVKKTILLPLLELHISLSLTIITAQTDYKHSHEIKARN
jgi:hypothetical protein